MSEYKRLTAQKEDRYWEKEEFWQSAEEPSYEEIEELYSRLAELEDKIESGTLVEENKFYIKKSYRNHDDQRYRIVEFIENEHYDGLTLEQAEAWVKEAEARLKELQEWKI